MANIPLATTRIAHKQLKGAVRLEDVTASNELRETHQRDWRGSRAMAGASAATQVANLISFHKRPCSDGRCCDHRGLRHCHRNALSLGSLGYD
jgi:hypothetical protein